MENIVKQKDTLPSITPRIPSWREVDGLFEPRSPEFKALRDQVHNQQRQELAGRLAINPTKDLDEISAGVFREQIEPQCRSAVFEMRRKGYQTYNSGFGVGNLQVLDGMLGELEPEVTEDLTANGYLVYETEPGNISIAFQPSQPDIDEMTARWDQLAEILPDRGTPALFDGQAREAFLGSFTQPDTYSSESAFMLEK